MDHTDGQSSVVHGQKAEIILKRGENGKQVCYKGGKTNPRGETE
jgi:hypothetical protein